MTTTRMRRRVNAPRARVYHALIDAGAVARWMVPTGMVSEIHSFEAREGGAFRISLTYETAAGTGKTSARTDTYHGRFVKLVPGELVVQAVEFETADPQLQGEMTIAISLADAPDGGTDIVAAHDGLPPGLSPTYNEAGWRSSLGKLAELVEASGGAAMTPASAPEVECEQEHASFAVSDVGAAAEFYTKKLGFRLSFTFGDPAEIAAVNLGNVQMFLERGRPNPQGCAVYFVVGNADELYEFQRANGVEIVEPPSDKPYGLRDYRVRDLHGYELGFGHHLFNIGPPIEIERVDVPVRLEKRLAALLQDLAAFKRMSVASCLEETLLHTLDGVGPHTKTDLRHIQKLKQKHGIDYDSHGSYRFVERNTPGEKNE